MGSGFEGDAQVYKYFGVWVVVGDNLFIAMADTDWVFVGEIFKGKVTVSPPIF